MGLDELMKAFGGGALAAMAALLVLAILGLFALLNSSKNERITRAEARADLLDNQLQESKSKHLATAIEVAPLAVGLVRLHDDLAARLEKVEQERLELEVLRGELERERDELKRLRRLPRAKESG